MRWPDVGDKMEGAGPPGELDALVASVPVALVPDPDAVLVTVELDGRAVRDLVTASVLLGADRDATFRHALELLATTVSHLQRGGSVRLVSGDGEVTMDLLYPPDPDA